MLRRQNWMVVAETIRDWHESSKQQINGTEKIKPCPGFSQSFPYLLSASKIQFKDKRTLFISSYLRPGRAADNYVWMVHFSVSYTYTDMWQGQLEFLIPAFSGKETNIINICGCTHSIEASIKIAHLQGGCILTPTLFKMWNHVFMHWQSCTEQVLSQYSSSLLWSLALSLKLKNKGTSLFTVSTGRHCEYFIIFISKQKNHTLSYEKLFYLRAESEKSYCINNWIWFISSIVAFLPVV